MKCFKLNQSNILIMSMLVFFFYFCCCCKVTKFHCCVNTALRVFCCCFFPSLTTTQTPWNPFKDVCTTTTITRVPSNTWSAVFKTSSPVTVKSSQKTNSLNRQKERPLSVSTVNVVETMENAFPFTTVQRDLVSTSAAVTKQHYHICLWSKIKQFSLLTYFFFFFFLTN